MEKNNDLPSCEDEVYKYIHSSEFDKLINEGLRKVELQDIEKYGKKEIKNNPYYEPNYNKALELIKNDLAFDLEDIKICISESWDGVEEDRKL